MYDTKFISVTSHDLDPSPCHKLSHFLGPLSSSVTYFMDGPLIALARAVRISWYIILLPLLTARAAARAEVFLPGHLPWCGVATGTITLLKCLW